MRILFCCFVLAAHCSAQTNLVAPNSKHTLTRRSSERLQIRARNQCAVGDFILVVYYRNTDKVWTLSREMVLPKKDTTYDLNIYTDNAIIYYYGHLNNTEVFWQGKTGDKNKFNVSGESVYFRQLELDDKGIFNVKWETIQFTCGGTDLKRHRQVKVRNDCGLQNLQFYIHFDHVDDGWITSGHNLRDPFATYVIPGAVTYEPKIYFYAIVMDVDGENITWHKDRGDGVVLIDVGYGHGEVDLRGLTLDESDKIADWETIHLTCPDHVFATSTTGDSTTVSSGTTTTSTVLSTTDTIGIVTRTGTTATLAATDATATVKTQTSTLSSTLSSRTTSSIPLCGTINIFDSEKCFQECIKNGFELGILSRLFKACICSDDDGAVSLCNAEFFDTTISSSVTSSRQMTAPFTPTFNRNTTTEISTTSTTTQTTDPNTFTASKFTPNASDSSSDSNSTFLIGVGAGIGGGAYSIYSFTGYIIYTIARIVQVPCYVSFLWHSIYEIGSMDQHLTLPRDGVQKPTPLPKTVQSL
eukprot:m.93008 g.93008  ORF g.93008 m.93008 type:complete len:527 (+) comp13376_c0_seq1:242-1822(+)